MHSTNNKNHNIICDEESDFLQRFEKILANYLKFSKILSFDILSQFY